MSYLNDEEFSELEIKPTSCATCKFWKQVDDAGWKKISIDPFRVVEWRGECTRHAPRITLADIESEENIRSFRIENIMAALWPETTYDESCGDWMEGNNTAQPLSKLANGVGKIQ